MVKEVDNPKKEIIFRYIFITLLTLSATVSLTLNIPYIKLILGGFLVFFLPGFLIMSILKIEKINKIVLLILSIALSISTIMLEGIICNYFGLLFHFSEPLGFTPMIITTNITIFILLGITLFYDRYFHYRIIPEIAASINFQDINLFLGGGVIIVLTFITYFHHSSRLFLLIYIFIGLLFLMAGVKKEVNDSSLFFVIFAISFALIFTNVFSSPFLRGGDVHFEYLISETIKGNGLIWHQEVKPPIATRLNSVIPVVILAPMVASLFKISILEVFKTIFPFIILVIPLALFAAYKCFFSVKIAFFSAFFVISIPLFPNLLPSMIREIFALTFLSVIILLLYEGRIKGIKKKFLLIFFGISLILSHYGVPYILALVMLISIMVLFIINYFKLTIVNIKEVKNTEISSTYVFILLVLALSWGTYVNKSYNLNTIVYLLEAAISSADSVYNLANIPVTTMANVTVIQILNAYSYVAIFILIFLMISYKLIKKEINSYYILATSSLLILPVFVFKNPSYELPRIIFLCILFESPIFIEAIYSVFRIEEKMLNNASFPKVIIFVLVLFFMLQNGVISEVINDVPISYSTNYEKMQYAFTFEEDVILARWISTYTGEHLVMIDVPGHLTVYDGFYGDPFKVSHKYNCLSSEKMNDSYLVVRKGNILTNRLQTKGFGGFCGTEWTDPLDELLSTHSHNDKLYDCGGEVYYVLL